jgi:hypothetical protein
MIHGERAGPGTGGLSDRERIEAARGPLLAALVITLWVSACGLAPPSHDSSPAGAMAHMPADLGWENCPISVWVTGVIVRGSGGQAVIRDDQGVVRSIVWGSSNTGVVDWDRRYRIGGSWFNTDDTLWACGGVDAVIPQ